MSTTETSAEVKAKILLDEANLAFSETSERRDSKGERNLEGSAWEEGRMEGEYDEADYQKILELQMNAAIACDEHPELEDKTAASEAANLTRSQILVNAATNVLAIANAQPQSVLALLG